MSWIPAIVWSAWQVGAVACWLTALLLVAGMLLADWLGRAQRAEEICACCGRGLVQRYEYDGEHLCVRCYLGRAMPRGQR